MLRQGVRERCETILRQHEEQSLLLQDEAFCRDYERCVETEQARRALEPIVIAYREYRQITADVAEGAALLNAASGDECIAAQDFYD